MSAVKRLIVPIAALGLLVAACGGDGAAPSSSSTTTTVTQATGDADPSAPGPADGRPDGPVAPDFALALGEGGSFVLSDEQKPVYMIFWAEW